MNSTEKTVSPLDSYTAAGLTLEDTVRRFQQAIGNAELIGLLYGPQCCCFVRVGADKAFDFPPEGRSIELEQVFEARLFTEQAELRWLKTGSNNHGQAAIIAEPETVKPDEPIQGFEHSPQPFRKALRPLEQHYILWGKQAALSTSEQWGCLSAGRIGRLLVPLAAPKDSDGNYMVLHSKEYLDCDEFGNVFVAQERLTKLEWKTY